MTLLYAKVLYPSSRSTPEKDACLEADRGLEGVVGEAREVGRNSLAQRISTRTAVMLSCPT